MKELGKIVMHIPAREGSKRVPHKNIRNMAGSPMISYAISAALTSRVTENVYVNTDSEEIISYVQSEFPDINVYQRSKELADDKSQSDHFNMDIINALKPDTLVMINPVCPLIEARDIQEAIHSYAQSGRDTLITCSTTQMQTFCDDNPVNVNPNDVLAPSQDNPTIQVLNWAITIWDAQKFTDRFNRLGYAAMGEKRLLHPIDHLKSFKVSEEKDFKVCESLLCNMRKIN